MTERLRAIAAGPAPALAALPFAAKPRSKPERSARDAVFRPAKLFYAKNVFVRCVVRNLSPAGAQVIMEGAVPLPPEVSLKFEQNGVIKKARIAWQEDNLAGLAFVSAADASPVRDRRE